MNITTYPLAPDPRIVQANSSDDELYVTIQIENGQAGGSRVTLGEEIIVQGDLGVQSHLGKAGDLQGKIMEFRSNVTDINLTTNHCVISTKITNQDNNILFLETDNGDAPRNGLASFIGKYVVQLSVLVSVLFVAYI